MVGSGHADCQKASPRYSRSSQRLHWTAVNQKMMQSTAESPSLSREVETRQAGASLPTSARALSTDGKQGADRRHDAGDGEEKGCLAHGNFRTHPPAQQPERRQQGGQKQDVAVQFEDGAEGRRRKADDRDEEAVSTAVRRGAFTCSHRGARQRNAPGRRRRGPENSVQIKKSPRSGLLSASKLPPHMAELVLCELGEQGVLILLAHRQAGAIQHLESSRRPAGAPCPCSG